MTEIEKLLSQGGKKRLVKAQELAAIPQICNYKGVPVKMWCPTCKFYEFDDGVRLCVREKEAKAVDKKHRCEHWTMSTRFHLIGGKSEGKVKPRAYFVWQMKMNDLIAAAYEHTNKKPYIKNVLSLKVPLYEYWEKKVKDNPNYKYPKIVAPKEEEQKDEETTDNNNNNN